MASAPQEQLIGEFRYIVTPLTARKSAHVFTRLAKILAAVMDSEEGSSSKALAEIDDDTVDYLIDAFAPTTSVVLSDTRSPQLNTIFDVHFQGRAKEMFEWLGFCIKVNYADFFGGLATIGPRESPTSTAGSSPK